MYNFNISEHTKFWIYTTTTKLWKELETHLQNSDDMFISTFIFSAVNRNEIVIIYVKNKSSPSKTGFVCLVQTKSDQMDNSHGKIKIFMDQNLNKYCYQLSTVVFLPELVKIDGIIPYISSIPSFKSKTSFITKYLKYDSVFNKLDYDIGKSIMEGFFTILPESINFEDKNDELIDDSCDDISTDSKNKNNLENENNKDNEDNGKDNLDDLGI